MPILVNFIAFQIAWLACVIGGAHQWPWLGVIVTAVVVALHLYHAARPKTEAILLILSGLMGLFADSLLTIPGLLQFPSGQFHPGLAPYWMIALWIAFATTCNVSLRWLKPRLKLAALLGAIAGPLAYYGGSELGGVLLTEPLISLLAVGGIWAAAMPLLLIIANRYDGMAETNRANAAHDKSATADKPA
ncbi:MAG: DUF2878 domain-containing protein [Synechococcaceae cyanobacterium SM1_2_3]|nr:DUF2878 domain-containing protein [Synechococcaceae cyanobacterium SM1_2_3]